ncbi:MAG: 3-oxoacyl-[acyl-carrier-protein] reductase [Alphaproteobacteria bacterium]
MAIHHTPLKGKTALITGSARGIGKVTALTLARAGAAIALVDVMGEVTAAAEEVRSTGVQAAGYTADVTNTEQITELVKQVVQTFGSVDILVNNAGITRDGLILRMSDADWDSVLAVNLRGAFVCARAVARIMLKQKSGRIINIASVVGVMGNAGQANYAASKAGLIGLTKTLARELGSRGITVNAIAPGYIETAMTAKLSDEAREALLKQIPLTRLGQVQDVAQAVLFLSSEQAAYITGHVLHVDGGMAM